MSGRSRRGRGRGRGGMSNMTTSALSVAQFKAALAKQEKEVKQLEAFHKKQHEEAVKAHIAKLNADIRATYQGDMQPVAVLLRAIISSTKPAIRVVSMHCELSAIKTGLVTVTDLTIRYSTPTVFSDTTYGAVVNYMQPLRRPKKLYATPINGTEALSIQSVAAHFIKSKASTGKTYDFTTEAPNITLAQMKAVVSTHQTSGDTVESTEGDLMTMNTMYEAIDTSTAKKYAASVEPSLSAGFLGMTFSSPSMTGKQIKAYKDLLKQAYDSRSSDLITVGKADPAPSPTYFNKFLQEIIPASDTTKYNVKIIDTYSPSQEGEINTAAAGRFTVIN